MVEQLEPRSWSHLDLPGEIRNSIYECVFESGDIIVGQDKRSIQGSRELKHVQERCGTLFGQEERFPSSPDNSESSRQETVNDLLVPHTAPTSPATKEAIKRIPTAFLLTCRQINIEATLYLYGSYTFHFKEEDAMHKSLEKVGRRGKRAVRHIKRYLSRPHLGRVEYFVGLEHLDIQLTHRISRAIFAPYFRQTWLGTGQPQVGSMLDWSFVKIVKEGLSPLFFARCRALKAVRFTFRDDELCLISRRRNTSARAYSVSGKGEPCEWIEYIINQNVVLSEAYRMPTGSGGFRQRCISRDSTVDMQVSIWYRSHSTIHSISSTGLEM